MNTDSTRVKQPQWMESISAYSLHALVATAGSAILAALLAAIAFMATGLLKPPIPLAPFQQVLINRYFPLQVAVSFALGYLVSGKLPQKRYAPWAWIAPAAVLLGSLVLWRPATVLDGGWSSTALHHFFGARANGSITNLDQFTRTMPFFASVGYAIGATAKRRLGNKTDLAAGATGEKPSQ